MRPSLFRAALLLLVAFLGPANTLQFAASMGAARHRSPVAKRSPAARTPASAWRRGVRLGAASLNASAPEWDLPTDLTAPPATLNSALDSATGLVEPPKALTETLDLPQSSDLIEELVEELLITAANPAPGIATTSEAALDTIETAALKSGLAAADNLKSGPKSGLVGLTVNLPKAQPGILFPPESGEGPGAESSPEKGALPSGEAAGARSPSTEKRRPPPTFGTCLRFALPALGIYVASKAPPLSLTSAR